MATRSSCSLCCLFWLGSGSSPSVVFPSLQLLYVVGIPISLCSARPPPFPSPPTSRAPPSSFPTRFPPVLLSKTTRGSRFSLNLYYDTFAFSRLDNRSQPSEQHMSFIESDSVYTELLLYARILRTKSPVSTFRSDRTYVRAAYVHTKIHFKNTICLYWEKNTECKRVIDCDSTKNNKRLFSS